MIEYQEVLFVVSFRSKTISPPYPFNFAEKVAQYIEFKLGQEVQIERYVGEVKIAKMGPVER